MLFKALAVAAATAAVEQDVPAVVYHGCWWGRQSSGLSANRRDKLHYFYSFLPPLTHLLVALFVYPSRRLGISLTHEVRCISSRAARRPCISSRVSVHLTCGLPQLHF